ncbi:hypothetical protein [Streptomyces sp. NPDC047009]|uniref:hypothetical protein n=1 Tax=Streptomyces sp. NPDC047009 TaxID=3154496 RepID=UPI0033E96D97
MSARTLISRARDLTASIRGVRTTLSTSRGPSERQLDLTPRHNLATLSADNLLQVLRLFAAVDLTAEGHTLPSHATHDALLAELTRRSVPHEDAGDSQGDFVVISIGGDYSLHLRNPLDVTYGFDWQLLNPDGFQMLAGTWHEDPEAVASRLAALLTAAC